MVWYFFAWFAILALTQCKVAKAGEYRSGSDILEAQGALCDVCALLPTVPRWTAAEFEQLDQNNKKELLLNGVPFIITNSTAGCMQYVSPVQEPSYWVAYAKRAERVAQQSSDPDERFQRMFEGLYDSHMGRARPRDADVAWCGGREGVVCGNGTLQVASSESDSVIDSVTPEDADSKQKAAQGPTVLIKGAVADSGPVELTSESPARDRRKQNRRKGSESWRARREVQLSLGTDHGLDFYVGWSNNDRAAAQLFEEHQELRECMPILRENGQLVRIGAAQWWRVGRTARAPVIGEPLHLDQLGMATECHMQLSGDKVWRLKPVTGCALACPLPAEAAEGVDVLVKEGDMFCLSIDKLRHQTYVPLMANGRLSVDLAYDLYPSSSDMAEAALDNDSIPKEDRIMSMYPEEIAIFFLHDSDEDGFLSRKEAAVMWTAGDEDAELDEDFVEMGDFSLTAAASDSLSTLWPILDTNKDERISVDEWSNCMNKVETEDELQIPSNEDQTFCSVEETTQNTNTGRIEDEALLKQLDTDRNGYLSKEEAQKWFEGLEEFGPNGFEFIWAKMDLNGNGAVSLGELADFSDQFDDSNHDSNQ